MASSDSAPPPPGSDDPKPSPPENALPIPSVGEATGEQPKEISPESVFVNNQPIREDQVQNAVKFLSHPKVRGSPVIHRRNFLERKGLTKDEIDEAFRRVPDPSPTVTSGQVTSTDGQVKPSAAIQQNPPQTIQPVASSSSRGLSFLPNQFHWTHAIFAVGFLATSGAGLLFVFKRSIVPRFKSWVRQVVSNEENVELGGNFVKPSSAEQVTAAAKAIASAAADVASSSQEIVIMQSEGNKRMEELMNLYSSQIQEMKLMRTSIASLEGRHLNAVRNIHVEDEYHGGSFSRVQQPMSNGGTEFDSRSVRSISPPVYPQLPYPKSYAETMARVQRGERPPITRDIDDSPFNRSRQPSSNPHLASRSMPWETVQHGNGTSFASQTPFTNDSQNIMVQDNHATSHQQLNNPGAPPAWWQQKNTGVTEIENDPVSGGGPVEQQPSQRKWVPPQPPPVVMPEAAVAIRQPKSTAAPQDADVKLLPAPHDNAADELQRIQQISESGGLEDMNAEDQKSSSEIQEYPVGS